MADVAIPQGKVLSDRRASKRSSLKYALQRKSTVAFLMTLPLILLIAALVVYPALYAVHLATLPSRRPEALRGHPRLPVPSKSRECGSISVRICIRWVRRFGKC